MIFGLLIEKKNEEGKGGRYLVKEDIPSEPGDEAQRRKGSKYLERENISFLEEKEKEENTGRRKHLIYGGNLQIELLDHYLVKFAKGITLSSFCKIFKLCDSPLTLYFRQSK